MTKGDLIYDWRKSEGSFRDKLASFAMVAVLFAVFFWAFQVRYAAPRHDRSGSATILRFRDDDLGRYWMLQAEEGGPFPGRLEFGGHLGSLPIEGMGGAEGWNDYRSQLRAMGEDVGYSRENLASRGTRVFPSRVKPYTSPPAPGSMRQRPILIPYDPDALARMPEALPDFVMPGDAEPATASWRFTINLDKDGAVREAISLGGGDDAGPAAMENWLRGVRFKPAEGDRWLGLRVEFINQPDDGTQPE